MEHEWGHWAGVAVRFSIVVGSAGFLVLYLIVLADLLVGARSGARGQTLGGLGGLHSAGNLQLLNEVGPVAGQGA